EQKFAVVHDAANRGICGRCYLDEIQAGVLGSGERLLNAHDADLFPVDTDHTDPRRSDLLVAPDAFTLDYTVLLNIPRLKQLRPRCRRKGSLPKRSPTAALLRAALGIMYGLSGQRSILRSRAGLDKPRGCVPSRRRLEAGRGAQPPPRVRSMIRVTS